MTRRWIRQCAASASLLLAPTCVAQATEFGQTHIDLAFADQLTGFAIPPGFYFRSDTEDNYSTRLNDQNGNPVVINAGPFGKAPIKFYNNFVAQVFSLAYKSPYSIPGTNISLGTAAYGAYVFSRAEAQFTLLGNTTGSGETRRGLDDITFVPIFFQDPIPSKDIYFTLAPFDFTAPTGQYNHDDPIGDNIGFNYWSLRPALEFTYLNKTGQEVSINYNMSFNTQNNATKYKSGDELSFTYLLQQHLNRALAIGTEGYYYTQITNDTQNGVVVNTVRSPDPFVLFDPQNNGPGNRGQVFAIGPSINYQPKPWFALNAHYEHEVFSINRAQNDVLWLRALVVF